MPYKTFKGWGFGRKIVKFCHLICLLYQYERITLKMPNDHLVENVNSSFLV